MNKGKKTIIAFMISFVISFFIVGYIRNTMFVAIRWVDDVTIWDKWRWYYISTFFDNIIPSLAMAIIFTSIYYLRNKNRR